MNRLKYKKDAVVYSETSSANFVYFLLKGSFEMYKVQSNENIFAEKFPHMNDLPKSHRISIFQAGSMIGEEDVFAGGKHSKTLLCSSQKGTLLALPR